MLKKMMLALAVLSLLATSAQVKAKTSQQIDACNTQCQDKCNTPKDQRELFKCAAKCILTLQCVMPLRSESVCKSCTDTCLKSVHEEHSQCYSGCMDTCLN